jgi:hypothetical protein
MADNQKVRIAPLLSALAVTTSLVFVGVEVRNNTIAARGATMQAISDASSTFMADMALEADFGILLARMFEGATSSEFTPGENQQLLMNLIAFVRMLENTYLQHREGLVPDAVFESYGWNDLVTHTPYFAEFWAASADGSVSPDFQQFFESRVQIGP